MQERRLSAIMFTDIVGYTALMGSDEDKAFEVLRKNREIHSKFISQFHGTLIKEMGDGMLISFDLASEAVRCAIEIQKECKAEDIPLKIGIHEGEMVFEGNDVLGDGVNIASRIQDGMDQGCIMISGAVYRDIKNKTDIFTEYIGDRSFKNVDESLKIYKVFCEYREEQVSLKKVETQIPKKKSIIVLPFVNISPDPEQEYFSDGLTEEIITNLTQINDLLVISRSSAMTFKNSQLSIKEIKDKVNVRYVLEGSVRKAGNNLRITAQLIDAANDIHLWAETYKGTIEDIFDIQENVSRSITGTLQIKLSATEKKQIDTIKINNTTAYEQYLLARYEIWQCTGESLKHAIEVLENSIENYERNEFLLVALAYAHLQFVNIGIDPDIKHLDKADNFVEEALSINPKFGKGYTLKGMLSETRGLLNEAFSSTKKALELDPADSEAQMMMSFMLCMIGRPQMAKPYAEQAITLDPLNILVYYGLWWTYLCEGAFDSLLEVGSKMYQIDKNNFSSNFAYIYALALGGKINEATRIIDSFINKYPDEFSSSWIKVFRYALNDQKKETLELISDEIKNAAEMDHLLSWELSECYALIDEKEKSIDCLERAAESLFINYPFFVSIAPFLENIRGEERFKKLMARVKNEWKNFDVKLI